MSYSWWRLAFIFLPAAVRGDIGSLGLYVPFIFGYFVRNVQKELIKKPNKRSLFKMGLPPSGYIPSFLMLGGFLFACWFKRVDNRSLPNFFISSFVCPMIRHWFPKSVPDSVKEWTKAATWGDVGVYVFLICGLITTWLYQGIDHLFVGFLFLQAVPEMQRHFWFKDTQHMFFLIFVFTFSAPFVSVGLAAWYFPTYLEYFPQSYLKALIWVANAAPNLTDYYLVLGLEKGASDPEIRKAYRKLARQYHPDKVGDDPVSIKKFHKIAEANAQLINKEKRAQYDELMGNPELHELQPRCVAFLVMMGYWLLHALIDWNDVEGVKESHKKFLRNHILGGGPVNLRGLGLSEREPLEHYVRNEDNDLPFLQQNNREELLELRGLLKDVGMMLDPCPSEEDGGDCILPKGDPPPAKEVLEVGGEVDVTDARDRAARKLGYGPASKSEAKQYKSKMNRYKAYTKKEKAGMMSNCTVQ